VIGKYEMLQPAALAWTDDHLGRRTLPPQSSLWWATRNEWLEREEKSAIAIAIASNEACSGWTKTFTDPRLSPRSSTGSQSPGQMLEEQWQMITTSKLPQPTGLGIEHTRLG
jgi:hypothetical protein